MRKILITLCLALLPGTALAGTYLTLGYHYLSLASNPDLGLVAGLKPELDFDAGYLFPNGLNLSFRYDHLTFDDYEKDGKNVRVVSVVPAVGVGYAYRCSDKLGWWVNAFPGYAVSTRYRLGIDDYKARTVSLVLSTSGYYQLRGKFYIGAEIGWRYLQADLQGSTAMPVLEDPKLNLGGFFGGLSIKHMF